MGILIIVTTQKWDYARWMHGGRATVVMDRKDYSAKMLMMRGGQDTYQLMAKDPTTSLENRMNSVLLRLRREGRLSGKTYYHLRSTAAGVPRLYGLPKVHKPDVSLHLIVSLVSSPTYARRPRILCSC